MEQPLTGAPGASELATTTIQTYPQVLQSYGELQKQSVIAESSIEVQERQARDLEQALNELIAERDLLVAATRAHARASTARVHRAPIPRRAPCRRRSSNRPRARSMISSGRRSSSSATSPRSRA